MSKCDRIRRELAYYAIGALGGRSRRRVEAHLRACPSCRAELVALERTGALLEKVGPESAPDDWHMVKGTIEAAQLHRRAPRLRWGWAMGAAALLILVVGALVWRPIVKTPAPTIVSITQADDEMRASLEGHLAAVWAAPLADEAAVGLRMADLEGEG